MMTRARQRRRLLLHGQSLGTTTRDLDAPPGESPIATIQEEEWRDWANNLLPEFVDDISGRLLAADVSEYFGFRAVCRPWRDLTADPHATPLDSRFRPRNWAALTITPDGSGRTRRNLLNLSTAASLGVDLPALSTHWHCHLCAADGLLVLYHRYTAVIRLVDPLTNVVTEFPPITAAVGSLSRPPEFVSQCSRGVIFRTINGAAFDDSTAPPTLVLCLRGGICNIVVAKPGAAHWTRVDEGDAAYPPFSRLDRVLFHSLLSMGGRCYVSSPEGSVYLLNLHPFPRLQEVVNQRCLAVPGTVNNIVSYLIFRDSGGGGTGRMMMVRYWRSMSRLAGVQGYNDRKKDQFTVGGVTGSIELLEVDLTGRRLLPVRSLGGRSSVFIGSTHCLLISTETFPSIAANVIYLGCLLQRRQRFGVYHINKVKNRRRTGPPHEFARDVDRGVVPAAHPCNLDQYLACYVDCKHAFRAACINHVEHLNH